MKYLPAGCPQTMRLTNYATFTLKILTMPTSITIDRCAKDFLRSYSGKEKQQIKSSESWTKYYSKSKLSWSPVISYVYRAEGMISQPRVSKANGLSLLAVVPDAGIQ